MEQNQSLVSILPARAKSKQAQGRGIRPAGGDSPHFLPAISIIVPAHNEEDYLGATLNELIRQEYPEFEIVVVANGCRDRTADVAQGRCHRLVILSQKSLGVARNLGARMATGELLVFLDADTLLEDGALRIIAEQFTERNSGGTLKGQPDSNRFAYRLIYWLKNFIHCFVVHNGSSGVILCWRKDFIRVGGFDEQLELRENSDLIRRLKHFGGYKFISATIATTSMRRYERRGVGRIVWLWIRLWFFGCFGDLRNRKYEPVR
jgi:glycosyltransferase involved in cell wall biosynthesis